MSASSVNNRAKIKKITVIALFIALAYIAMFVFRIKVSFLTFDMKDAIVTLAGLLFGPVNALIISFSVALLEGISVSETGVIGFVMNFLSTSAFSVTAAVVYKYKKNIRGAVVGLVGAVLSTTAIMLVLNLLLTPLYVEGATTADVAKMIPTLLLPFNFTKALLNAAIVLIVYKPVSKVMKRTGIVNDVIKEKSTDNNRSGRAAFSLTVSLIGATIVVICLVVFFVVLEGNFSLHG